MLLSWSCRQRTAHHVLCWLIAVVLAINLYVIFRLTVLDESSCLCPESEQLSTAGGRKNSSLHKLAFIIWDFEDFENDLRETVKYLSSAEAGIVIVSDHSPYPPLAIPKTRTIHLVNTNTQLSGSVTNSHPEFYFSSCLLYTSPSPRD